MNDGNSGGIRIVAVLGTARRRNLSGHRASAEWPLMATNGCLGHVQGTSAQASASDFPAAASAFCRISSALPLAADLAPAADFRPVVGFARISWTPRMRRVERREVSVDETEAIQTLQHGVQAGSDP